MAESRRSLAPALFAALLRLAPASLRERHGAEMRATFAARCEEAGRRGNIRRLAFATRELGALLSVVIAAHRQRRTPDRSIHPDTHRRSSMLDTLTRDARFAVRTMLRNPGFAATAVIVLAIGIGANTAIFTVVNDLLLAPLPVASPRRLVSVWEENPEKGWYMQTAAPANFLDWREQVSAFQDAAAYYSNSFTMTGGGDPAIVTAASVTGNFFDVAGVRAAAGRVFREEETWADAPRTVILSDGLWERRFGRDPAVIGSTVTLDGEKFEVVGIMPARFTFPFDAQDIWVPARWARDAPGQIYFRRAHWVSVIARLAPGVTVAEADRQLQLVVTRLQQDYPETNSVMGAGLTPLQAFLVRERRTPLLLLLGAVGLLLLIACANVGNLLLVRAVGRRRELGLRTALGAERRRLVRQMMTESLLLSAAGGAGGILLGLAGVRMLGSIQPANMPRVGAPALDGRVVAYAIAITIASGVLFGILPAWKSARIGLSQALHEGSRTGTAGRRTLRAGNLMVVVEVALALLLVAGAGLLVRTSLALREVDPGFRTANRIAVRLSLPDGTYPNGTSVVAFYDALESGIEALPGVQSVALTSTLPLTGSNWSSDFSIAGRGPDDFGAEVWHREVDADYFATMGVPVARGRPFTDADRVGGEPVVIINEALAGRFFADEDPIGQRISFDRVPNDKSVWRRIVGVVGDELHEGLDAPARIEIMAPIRQDVRGTFSVIVHGASDPHALLPGIRGIVAGLDPELPIARVRTLEEVYVAALANGRFLLILLGVFASIALLLAAIGVYGVTSQAARRRTREIGIRVALGADGVDVVRLIVRQGMGVVLAGVVLGLGTGLAGARLMRGVIYGVPPTDPVTFVLVPVVLIAVAALACWLPARRATRVDPLSALRME